MFRKALLYSCLLLFWGSCDRLFSPSSPNPEDYYLKFFGGGATQDGIDVIELNSDEIFILGHTTSFNNDGFSELYLIKVNAEGNELSNKVWGVNGTDNFAVDFEITKDENHLIIMSNYGDSENQKIRVTKMNFEGNIIWEEDIGVQTNNIYIGADIEVLEDGNGFIMTGSSRTISQDISFIFASEINDNGGLIWERIYGFVDRESEFGVKITEYENNYLILGRSVNNSTDEKPIIIEANKSNSGGEILSSILYETEPGIIQAKSFKAMEDSNFVLLVELVDNTEVGLIEVKVISRDRVLPNIPVAVEESFELDATNFHPNNNGGFFITGNSNEDIFLIDVNRDGSTIWDSPRLFGGDGEDSSKDVIELSDKGILMIGTVDFSNGNSMIGIIKTTKDGLLEED